MFGSTQSTLSTLEHDHHRMRRGALSHFFAAKSITSLEPVIKAKVSKLVRRFEEATIKDEVIRLDSAFEVPPL